MLFYSGIQNSVRLRVPGHGEGDQQPLRQDVPTGEGNDERSRNFVLYFQIIF